jgi:hypothetical protein
MTTYEPEHEPEHEPGFAEDLDRPATRDETRRALCEAGYLTTTMTGKRTCS